MPHALPRITCPKCLHEFEYGVTKKICNFCGEPFDGRGDRRYCSKLCKVKANNWRAWLRLKHSPEYREKRRKYMREYMRTYKAGKAK